MFILPKGPKPNISSPTFRRLQLEIQELDLSRICTWNSTLHFEQPYEQFGIVYLRVCMNGVVFILIFDARYPIHAPRLQSLYDFSHRRATDNEFYLDILSEWRPILGLQEILESMKSSIFDHDSSYINDNDILSSGFYRNFEIESEEQTTGEVPLIMKPNTKCRKRTMHNFDTVPGKLFYCIYTLHRGKLISDERKAFLKDLVIQGDQRIMSFVTIQNEKRLSEQILTMTDLTVTTDSQQQLQSEHSEDNRSVRSSSLNRIQKPSIQIKKSNFEVRQRTGTMNN